MMEKKTEKIELTGLNNVTKGLLVILAVAVSYFVILLIVKPFFAPKTMMDMMNQISNGWNSVSLISLIIALVIGIILSYYLFKTESKDKEYSIIRKVLSDDERKILDEIKKAGKITQDSLRFRLGWSKAKVSTILTNLDKKEIVQRQRTGKTYNIYLQNVK